MTPNHKAVRRANKGKEWTDGDEDEVRILIAEQRCFIKQHLLAQAQSKARTNELTRQDAMPLREQVSGYGTTPPPDASKCLVSEELSLSEVDSKDDFIIAIPPFPKSSTKTRHGGSDLHGERPFSLPSSNGNPRGRRLSQERVLGHLRPVTAGE